MVGTMTVHQRNVMTRTASGINFFAGLWEIAAPFIWLYFTPAAVTNDIVVGIAVAVLAAIRFLVPRNTAWTSWITVLLGAWLVASPFVLGYLTSVALWNDIIMGLVIVGIGLWSAMARP